jgi:segregation and condensation protein B
MTEVPVEHLVEAMLFTAGKSLSPGELAEMLGYEQDEVEQVLQALKATIGRRRTPLHLVDVGGRWAMEVRPEVATHLPKETKTDLPPRLLKAASLIAYHQPMPQSRLVEMLGQRAYDHVRELAQRGMVQRRRDGNTRRLSTTRRFSEAFGCPHTDRKKVREWFRAQVAASGILDDVLGSVVVQDASQEEGTVQSTLPVDDEA